MLPTEPYNQRKRDPQSWRLSMAVIAGLLGIGMMIGGQTSWGALVLAGAVGLVLWSIYG